MGKEKEKKRKVDDERRRNPDKLTMKKKTKRTSPSSSPELPDEATRKRHRAGTSADETRKEKRDKSKSRRDKSHKTPSRSKEKKSGEKHGSKSHKRGKHSTSEIQEISSTDYFSKNNEFATWLKEEKKLFFSDLSSESARGLFSEFVAEWNDRKLESRYYEGIATGPRTSHKWNIRV